MSDRTSARPSILHLCVLPGGDSNVGVALFTTLFAYAGLLFFAVVALVIVGAKTPLEFAAANALPCAVIALWTAWRMHRSQPIATDQVGVDPARNRVWLGSDVFRVPARALVLPLSPRRWSGPLQDGRTLTVAYRLDPDPRDVINLGRNLAQEELDLPGYVEGVLSGYAQSLLPDPAGVLEVARNELLSLGVILTYGEVDGARV